MKALSKTKHQTTINYLGSAFSGVLLSITSLFPCSFVLAWVAFVPFLLVLQHVASFGQAYRVGLVFGLVLYVLSTYWMVDFLQLLKDYSFVSSIALSAIYWFYCAQMIALIAVVSYWLKKNNAQMWVFAIVTTGVFAVFPTLFSVQLGETQSEFLIALQAIEITGVFGLDFVIVLVNGLVAQAIVGENSFAKRSTGLAHGLVILWFAYGAWSLSVWTGQEEKSKSINVGMIQANQAPSTGAIKPEPGYSFTYPLEMALSEQLLQHQVDLLVWPEMRPRDYDEENFVQQVYAKQVRSWQTPLLFQDRELLQNADGEKHYNTAIFLDETGLQAEPYRKIKLIPVAETLPWLQDNVEAKRWLRQEFGDFFIDYSPGTKPVAFSIESAQIIPLICYEVMFPKFVANSVSTIVNTGQKNPSVLVALSNNGWFGETRQPFQHLGASVLRSVENRLPMIHAVNNGPGAIVLPSGKKSFQTAYRESAAYVVSIPLMIGESGNTFYNRNPWLFLIALSTMFLVVVLRRWLSKVN